MDQEKIKEKELDEKLDNDDEAAPSFKDEMRAVGKFFKKLLGKSASPIQESEIDEQSTSNHLLTENESKIESLDNEQIFGLQDDGQITENNDTKLQEIIDISPNLSKDQEEVKVKTLDVELEDDDEDAPSFKDEMRAVGQFFKNLFGGSSSGDNIDEIQTKGDLLTKKDEINKDTLFDQIEPKTLSSNQINEQLEERSLENENALIINSGEENQKKKKRKWFKRKRKPELSEEQIQLKKTKFYKGLSSTFLFLLIFFSVGFFGFTSTSKKEFCKSCHEMRPEHYTMMASSHSDLECVDCHTNPGLEEMFKEKVRTFNMFSAKMLDRADIPINLKQEIPDKACLKCHNMDKRTVSATGDLIIPHDKHQKNLVECVFCHGGVAHGKIASRNVTKKSDYQNWDAEIGKLMMSDKSYIKTKMTTCTICHEARDVSNDCKTCHTTGMFPESHLKEDFKNTSHGSMARADIQKCDYCHQYTTKRPIEVVKTIKSYQNNGQSKEEKIISTTQYVLENDFCRDCHSKRPPSHQINNFFLKHGGIATINKEKCYGCHSANSNAKKSQVAAAKTVCGSCHPSSHKNNVYKEKHPIIKEGNVNKLQESCFRCHSRVKCGKCHDNFRIR